MIISDILDSDETIPLTYYAVTDTSTLNDFFRTLAPGYVGDNPTIKDLKEFLSTRPDDEHKFIWLNQEISEINSDPAQADSTINSASSIDPEQLNNLAKPDRMERITRQIVGGLYSIVMAFTIVIFTSVVAIVAIDKKEFPSATLVAIIIVPTMMVAWYYMGIINRERRDILSAIAGDKINSSVIGGIIDVVMKRRQ